MLKELLVFLDVKSTFLSKTVNASITSLTGFVMDQSSLSQCGVITSDAPGT